MITSFSFDLILAGVWIALQLGIGYYVFDLARNARRALGVLGRDGSDVAHLGRERYRALLYSLGAVPCYLAIGLITAFQLRDLRLVIGPILLLGQGVLLRNNRADARLLRDLARRIENEEPLLDNHSAPIPPG